MEQIIQSVLEKSVFVSLVQLYNQFWYIVHLWEQLTEPSG